MKNYEFCVLMVGGLAKSCAIAVLLIFFLKLMLILKKNCYMKI